MFKVIDQIRGYLEGILIIALLGSFTLTWYYRNSYEKEHALFELFKVQTKTLGDQAEKDKTEQEAKWRQQFSDQEKVYADNLKRHTNEFATELSWVRSSGSNPSEGGMPKATDIGVCSDEAGNRRLFDSLSIYREEERRSQIDTLQLFEACQVQTDTLVLCEERLETIVQQ